MQTNELQAALIYAADNNVQEVKRLLHAGADPNGMAFIMAIQCEAREVIEIMLQAGVRVNDRFQDTTPLIRAIESGHREIIRVLLDAGANPCFTSESGYSPLQAAQYNSHKGLTLDEKAQIYTMISTALRESK